MILEALNAKLIQYQKERDPLRVGVVRYLLSAIKNKEIEFRSQGMELSDAAIEKVIHKQIKQRNDSIEAYKSGNREDLVAKETAELEVLHEILAVVSNHD